MGAGGDMLFPERSHPEKPPARLPRISVAVIATAQFPDGTTISIERGDAPEAHDALWSAVCRELGTPFDWTPPANWWPPL